MNIYSTPPLISALLFLTLGIVTLLRSKQEHSVTIPFVLHCVTTFWWQFTWFILFNIRSVILAPYLVKIGYSGIIFIPTTFFHFYTYYLNLDKNKKWVNFYYFIGFVFLILLWTTDAYIKGLYTYFWGYYPKAGILHPVYLAYLTIMAIHCFYSLIYSGRQVGWEGIRANQIKYLISALFIYCFASSDFIVNYGVEFYPLGFLAILVSLGIVAYAIVRHHLMDIDVLIKKSLVFAGMFAFAFGVFVTVALLISQVFGAGRLISLAISALIITIGLRPIETCLINVTDKFLFQKKYEYKQILKTFIDEVITVLNLDEVVSSTLRLLDQTLHPYTQAIFILNKVEDKYQIYSSMGLDNKNISFSSDSKLVNFLKKSQNPAIIKQIDGIIGVSPEILSEMSQLKAVVVLPLLLHNDLIGFISLGRKKSDEEYTKDDLDVLQDLARTESIAVANAQLLAEAAQAERRAAIGTMSAGIHHEIGNPLNIISTKIQLFRLSNQRGLFKDKTKEEILQECESILDETIKQTNRISDITKKLANFAKPGREIKPELISIPDEIDETLAVVGHELELERIAIEKQISNNLSKILVDKRQFQQILFNLIKNAGQAIEQTGKIIIKALSTTDNKVHIEIIDTGNGIPEDKIHRIFEPFFTTKGPKGGTGLGLSIVRQLVWRNKGEITFRSQPGVGTTFILEFPKAG